jgi:hypothetical protein
MEKEDIEAIFDQIGAIIGGEEVFIRGSLRELLAAVGDGKGIPLDGNGDTPFDELSGDDDADSREQFVDSTNDFIGLAWWVPRTVGNEIQSDAASSIRAFTPNRSGTTTARIGD